MKNILFLITIMLSISLFSNHAIAQSKNQTVSIQVEGNCNMCKKRIEDAAYIKGVKRAEWDKSTGKLTVTYNSKSTSLDKIKGNIAAAGHDAEDVKAADDMVKKLPACCNYRHDEAQKH